MLNEAYEATVPGHSGGLGRVLGVALSPVGRSVNPNHARDELWMMDVLGINLQQMSIATLIHRARSVVRQTGRQGDAIKHELGMGRPGGNRRSDRPNWSAQFCLEQ